MSNDFVKKQQILYVGTIKVFSLEENQKKLLTRILLINLKSVYLYRDPFGRADKYQALIRSRNPVDQSVLMKPETELNMIDKSVELVLYDDHAFNAYLKQLNLQQQAKSLRALCIIIYDHEDQMEILGCDSQEQGIKLFEALRKYIGLKHYLKAIQQNKLSFNESLCRRMMNSLQTNITINPYDFQDEVEEIQLNIYLEFIRKTTIIQILSLQHKIIDQISLGYVNRVGEITKNKKVKILKIEKSMLSNTYLQKTLSFNHFSSIRSIILRENKLNDGCFKIFHSFFKNNQLQFLNQFDLAFNQITLQIQNKNQILSFFDSINYKPKLNLQSNIVQDPQFLLKYLIIAQEVPLLGINLTKNRLSEQSILKIISGYKKYRHKWQLVLDSVSLGDHRSFEFLSIQKQTNKNVKLKITKSSLFDRQQEQQEQQQQKQKQLEEDVIKDEKQNKQYLQKLHYAYEYGDFYSVKKILYHLGKKNIRKQDLRIQPEQKQKLKQQAIIIKDAQYFWNLNLDQDLFNKKLDQMIHKNHRKGIQGKGSMALVYIKYLRDKKIQQLIQNSYNPLSIQFQNQISDYSKYFQTSQKKQKQFLRINYQKYIKTEFRTLANNVQNYKQAELTYYEEISRINYLVSSIQNLRIEQVEMCRLQLKLVPAKVLRKHFYRKNNLCLPKRVIKVPQFSKIENSLQFLSTYDISEYPMEKSARNSNLQDYQGVMTALKLNIIEQAEIKEFAKVIIGFLKFIYSSPSKIIYESVQYIQYMTSLIRKNNNPRLFSEQLYLHMLTYNTKVRFKKGLLKSLFEYLSVVIPNTKQIQPYIKAHLIKYQPSNIQQAKLYFDRPKLQWVYSRQNILSIVNKNGQIQVPIKQVSDKTIICSIYHLSTISQLMEQLSKNPQLEDIKLQDYWVFSQSNQSIIGEYQIVGKVVSQHKQLLLRRIFFDGQILNKVSLNQMSQGQLENVFFQIFYNYLHHNTNQLQSYINQCSTKLIITSLIKNGDFSEASVNSMVKNIDSFIPKNISIDKIQILQNVKQAINKKISYKEWLINSIFEVSFYGASVSLYYTKQLFTIKCNVNFHQILIQQKQSGKVEGIKVILWNQLLDVHLDEQNMILTLVYCEGTSMNIKLYDLGALKSQQNLIQFEWLLNVYLCICGYAKKRIQCDNNILYSTENTGKCQVKPFERQKFKGETKSILLSLKKFIKQYVPHENEFFNNILKSNLSSKFSEPVSEQVSELKNQQLEAIKSKEQFNSVGGKVEEKVEKEINSQENIDKKQKQLQIEDIIKFNTQDNVVTNRRSSGQRRSMARKSRENK